jgi:hypothetical protein
VQGIREVPLPQPQPPSESASEACTKVLGQRESESESDDNTNVHQAQEEAEGCGEYHNRANDGSVYFGDGCYTSGPVTISNTGSCVLSKKDETLLQSQSMSLSLFSFSLSTTGTVISPTSSSASTTSGTRSRVVGTAECANIITDNCDTDTACRGLANTSFHEYTKQEQQEHSTNTNTKGSDSGSGSTSEEEIPPETRNTIIKEEDGVTIIWTCETFCRMNGGPRDPWILPRAKWQKYTSCTCTSGGNAVEVEARADENVVMSSAENGHIMTTSIPPLSLSTTIPRSVLESMGSGGERQAYAWTILKKKDDLAEVQCDEFKAYLTTGTQVQ